MPAATYPEPALLATDAVQLVPLRPSHLDRIWPMANDPRLWTYALMPMRTQDDIAAYLAEAEADRLAGTACPFLILDIRSGSPVPVGSTRFGEMSVRHRRVQIGWTWLGIQWQGTGLNAHIKWLMLDHAFRVWQCNRVELKADARNQQSRAAMEKLGAQYEGRLRKHLVLHDGYVRDSVYYSYIRDEWADIEQHYFPQFVRNSASKA